MIIHKICPCSENRESILAVTVGHVRLYNSLLIQKCKYFEEMGTEGLVRFFFFLKQVLKYFYSGLSLATLISDKAKIKKILLTNYNI